VIYVESYGVYILKVLEWFYFWWKPLGEAIGIPGSRVSYKAVEKGKVTAAGLPDNVDLKNPASYGAATATFILNCRDNIVFSGLTFGTLIITLNLSKNVSPKLLGSRVTHYIVL